MMLSQILKIPCVDCLDEIEKRRRDKNTFGSTQKKSHGTDTLGARRQINFLLYL